LLIAAARTRVLVIRRQEYYVESESLDGDGALRDRELHEPSRPTTTVVVAWGGGMSELENTIGGLIPRCRAADAELIIVGSTSIVERRRLARLWPQVRVIDAPTRLSHRKLREIGADAANGDIVVLLDDELPFASRIERQLPSSPVVEPEEEPQQSTAGFARWLEALAISANAQAGNEAASSPPHTMVASWRNVAALLSELSRFRMLRTSRAARS
jgi:hypothetical protein